MPERLMMFEVMLAWNMGMNASTTATGIVMMGTSAEGMCQRKRRMTSETMIISMMSSFFSVSIERRMRSDRSYTVTSSTPSGRDGFISSSFSLTRSMTLSAFSLWRMTTIPPTVSPMPL